MKKRFKKTKKHSKNKFFKIWLIAMVVLIGLTGLISLCKFVFIKLVPTFSRVAQANNIFSDELEDKRAKELSDQMMKDLVRDDYKDIYAHFDEGLKSVIEDEKGVNDLLHKLFDAYGDQAVCVYKANEIGMKVDSQGKRSVATFWYSYKTKKCPDNHFLKIDVVPSSKDGKLALVGLSINVFPKGAPPQWK